MNTVRTDLRKICSSLLLGIMAIGFGFGCGEDTLTSPSAVDRETGKETYEDTTIEDLDLAGVRRVVASTLNGTISLRGQASTSARLEIRKTVRASTMAEAQRIAKLVRVEVRIIDGELVIRSIQPESGPGVNVQVDYDLIAPAGLDLNLDVTNGEISVGGMSGAVMADLANGQIDIELWGDGGGAVSASVVNGVTAVTLPANAAYELSATTVVGCIIGAVGDSVVDQCHVGLQVVRLGEAGGIPCDLHVVNGTIEINRP